MVPRNSSTHVCKLDHSLRADQLCNNCLQDRMLVTRWQITTLLWRNLIIFIKAHSSKEAREFQKSCVCVCVYARTRVNWGIWIPYVAISSKGHINAACTAMSLNHKAPPE